MSAPACSTARACRSRSGTAWPRAGAASLIVVGSEAGKVNEKVDRQSRILEAVLRLLSRHGISGISMRSVAREADVALGLVNYHYTDKASLIRAALHRIEEQDVALVRPDPNLAAEERLRAALDRVADPEFLTTEYLSLRLRLWALAQAHEDLAESTPPPRSATGRGSPRWSLRPDQG